MAVPPRGRRIRQILTGTLIGTAAGLVVTWVVVYRPWEEHYRLKPANWWAGRFLEWKTTLQASGGRRDFTLEDLGLPPRPFWHDWAAAVGFKVETEPGSRCKLVNGDPAAVPVLRALLKHPSSRLRQVAVYGLVKVGSMSPDAVAALRSIVSEGLGPDSGDLVAWKFAQIALEEIEDEEAYWRARMGELP